MRNKEGSLSDPRGRGAIAAFITSLAPDGYFDDAARDALDIYLDITLQLSKRAAANDEEVSNRIDLITALGLGDADALGTLRHAA
ncbi:MAG: hypothetical protein ACXU8U_13455 [Asticcacaulis sp.]